MVSISCGCAAQERIAVLEKEKRQRDFQVDTVGVNSSGG